MAAVATWVSAGLSAVNCTSDSVANCHVPRPSGSEPSSETSGSGRRSGWAGRSIDVGTSASMRSRTNVPAFCWATSVLMPWKPEIEIGDAVLAGSVNVAYCQLLLAVRAVP